MLSLVSLVLTAVNTNDFVKNVNKSDRGSRGMVGVCHARQLTQYSFCILFTFLPQSHSWSLIFKLHHQSELTISHLTISICRSRHCYIVWDVHKQSNDKFSSETELLQKQRKILHLFLYKAIRYCRNSGRRSFSSWCKKRNWEILRSISDESTAKHC